VGEVEFEKKTGLSALSVHIKSVTKQRFFHEFALDSKALNFEYGENV